MKIKYNRAEDIMLVEISSDSIDFAEETDYVIVHFSESGKPVLLEISDASRFISAAVQSAMKENIFSESEKMVAFG